MGRNYKKYSCRDCGEPCTSSPEWGDRYGRCEPCSRKTRFTGQSKPAVVKQLGMKRKTIPKDPEPVWEKKMKGLSFE